jgi:hypothetical protein
VTVITVWWIGLLGTLVVFVPVMLYLLHSLWLTVRNIQIYAREALTGTEGIARNSRNFRALDDTIRITAELRAAVESVARKLNLP